MPPFHPMTAVAVLTAATALLPAVPARAADLELQVENVRAAEGDLMIAVYADAAAFRKQALRELKRPAQSPVTEVRIADLPAGSYAIALYQDRNRNQKLDTNLLGIPNEPYGFSGGPGNPMVPATWEQARFPFGPDAPRVVVRLSD